MIKYDWSGEKALAELPAGFFVTGVVGVLVRPCGLVRGAIVVGRLVVVVGVSHFPMQTVCLICFPLPPLIWQV